jgi:hypothetical protein
MEANSVKKKDMVASVGLIATAIGSLVKILKTVPGLAGWFTSLLKRRKRVYILMVGIGQGTGPEDIKDFKDQLREVAEGKANCIVTPFDVRLLEVKGDPEGLIVFEKPSIP